MPDAPTPKPLDFLALRGFTASATEVLQGVGGGGLVSLQSGGGGGTQYIPSQPQPPQPPPKSVISETEDIAEALWTAQSKLIERQSQYLASVSKELQTKWEDIPGKLKDRTIKETLIEEFLKWLGKKIADYFLGPVAGEIAELGIALVATAIRLLKALYNEGQAFCDAMQAENTALLDLEQSRENYELRSRILTQHDIAIHNLLSDISETEKTIFDSTRTHDRLAEISDTLKMIQAEDHIVQCPHTNHCIYTKSLVMDTDTDADDNL
jgi:hypothetical protein